MRILVPLLLPVSACAGAATLSELGPERLSDSISSIESVTVSRLLDVSYDTCPETLDVAVVATIRYPIELRYTLNLQDASVVIDGNSLAVSPSAAVSMTSVGAEVMTDDGGAMLNAAGMRVLSDGVFADMSGIAAHYGGALFDETIASEIRAKAAMAVNGVLDPMVDVEPQVTIDVDAPLHDPAPLPELDLCDDGQVTATPRSDPLSLPTVLGRGVFPIRDSGVAERVYEYLRNAAGDVIAYRTRSAAVDVAVGRVSITPRDQEVQLTDGRLNPRIVGGEKVPADKMMYAVAFAREADGKLRNYCGGTVIDANWVLTAAHCAVTDRSVAIIGRKQINGSGGKVHSIHTAWRHAQFDKESGVMYDFDIAMVALEEPTTAAPVELVSNMIPDADVVTAVGWGARVAGGDPVELLYWVPLEVVPLDTCKFAYRHHPAKVSDNMVCAGDENGDACQGDSGGGLFHATTIDDYRLAGIVSFGKGCRERDFPGVYTDITDFVTWIGEVKSASQNE